MSQTSDHTVVVIGAGVGGLASAMRLAHAGMRVTVLDRLGGPGGKMRTIPSDAGPVDAGPTVLTLKHVFEQLFIDTGRPIEHYLTLHPEPLLARHFWRDGTTLDLMRDHDQSVQNVAAAFGARAADDFAAFSRKSQSLFDAFEAPVMTASAPSNGAIVYAILKNPKIARNMAPLSTLAKRLARQFSDPRLAQLFGRYATYVGGSPYASPALLSLIAAAEARGVWYVEGGMNKLAQAMADRARELGVQFHFNAHVERIEIQDGRPSAVHTSHQRFATDSVLFNGDPKALTDGHLGGAVTSAVPPKAVGPRSLSAAVHSFAAHAEGVDLAGHNVFFGDDPRNEFAPIAQGQLPQDATLYVCAQDRFGGRTPAGLERFEIIMNAPPSLDAPASATQNTKNEGYETCQTRTFARLRDFGLRFTPAPSLHSLTMPQDFAAMFPASNGSLYGRSPHGMMAAFHRPTVRSAQAGLYLVGGGVHPGAGIPMVTLCAQHAAAAIISDLTSTSTCPKADTHGGTSTGSATTAPAPFQ